jgi:hypothetical protein
VIALPVLAGGVVGAKAQPDQTGTPPARDLPFHDALARREFV